MTKLTNFPITTTDRWADESIEGLCSPLCADVESYGSFLTGDWYDDVSGNIVYDLSEISAIVQTSGAVISGYYGTSGTMSGDFISGYYDPSGQFPNGYFISGTDITFLDRHVSGGYSHQPSSGLVVSEYGIRKAINDYIDNSVTGTNLGVGQPLFVDVDQGNVRLKRFTTQYPNRVNLSVSNGSLNINYDGRGQNYTTQISSFYVQGGRSQLWGNFRSLSGFSTIALSGAMI